MCTTDNEVEAALIRSGLLLNIKSQNDFNDTHANVNYYDLYSVPYLHKLVLPSNLLVLVGNEIWYLE